MWKIHKFSVFFFSSGCTVEDLVTFPGVKEAIPAAKVSDIFCLSVCLSILSIYI